MRFAPDGHALAYTHGYGGGGLSIQVVAVAAPSTVLAVLPAGHDPRWITTRHLIARSPDGQPSSTTVAGYVCEYVGANQGDLDAAGRAVGRMPPTARRACRRSSPASRSRRSRRPSNRACRRAGRSRSATSGPARSASSG